MTLLDETIDYLKELKRRVDELEAIRQKTAGLESKSREASGRTSDSCDRIKSEFSKRSLNSKRKTCDTDEMDEQETEQTESFTDENLTLTVKDQDVEMEFRCVLREGVLLEIVEALSNLHLDLKLVQSSNIDGVLSLKINSKV